MVYRLINHSWLTNPSARIHLIIILYKIYIILLHINISVLQGFLPLRKATEKSHWEKPYIFTCKNTIFLRVKISANQRSFFVAMFSCLGMDNSSIYIINRIIHGRLEIWNPSSRVHIWYRTSSISMWTREDKFHIYARPCIILYIIYSY